MTIYTHKSSGLSKPCPTEFRDKTKNFNHKKTLIIFAIHTTTRTNNSVGEISLKKLFQTSSTSENPQTHKNSFAFSKTHSQKTARTPTLVSMNLSHAKHKIKTLTNAIPCNSELKNCTNSITLLGFQLIEAHPS